MTMHKHFIRVLIGLALVMVLMVSIFAVQVFADTEPAAAASVGDVEYDTLGDAVLAAAPGDTVTLLRDIEELDGIIVDKTININQIDTICH